MEATYTAKFAEIHPDKEGASHNILIGHKAPITTVQTIVAIVSHDKVIAFRHHTRDAIGEILTGVTIGEGHDGHQALRRRFVQQDVVLHLAQLFQITPNVSGAIRFVVIDTAHLSNDLAIDRQYLVTVFHAVARHANHTLDVVHAGIDGVTEHNHIATLGMPQGHNLGAANRQANAVFVFVHQNQVAIFQCGQHGARRNAKWFDDERAQDEHKQNDWEETDAILN